MATTKAQQKAVNKYIKGKYDRLSLFVPKGRKQAIEARAMANGETVNGLTCRLYKAELGLTEAEWRRVSDDE